MMVRLGYAYGASDVTLVVTVLQAHGFFVRCEDGVTGQLLTNYTHVIGGMAITVLAHQAEAAAALLNDLPPLVPNRPGLLASVIIVLGFFLTGAPPPATGLYLRQVATVGRMNPA